MNERLVVFTDLDGTLLDHHTYSYAAASPALERLRRNQVPLILTSSKSLAEMEALRGELENPHPVIAENGAVLGIPTGYFFKAPGSGTEGQICPTLMGPSYSRIVDLLASLREKFGYRFEGFADWDDAGVMRHTELPESAAARARKRFASEPIVWQDSEPRRDQFIREVERYHLRTVRGGRFEHVLGTLCDKARAMQMLLNMYAERDADVRWQTIAAGDSPNDLTMLRNANFAVVIPGASGKTLDAADHDSTLFAREPGPVGWNAAINELLDRFQIP